MTNILSDTITTFTLSFFKICVLFVSTLMLYYYAHIRRNKEYYEKLKRFPPTLPTLPFIGHIYLFLGKLEDQTENIFQLYNQIYEKNSAVVVWLSYIPFVFVHKLHDVQIVSNKCLHRSTLGVFESLLGNEGIALAPPDKWRKTRHLINPAFSPHMLRQYLKVFNVHSKILVQKLRSKTGEIFDIGPYVILQNKKSATENMFGVIIDEENAETNEFLKAVSEFHMLETSRFFKPWLLFNVLFQLYIFITRKNKIYNEITKFVTKVIKTRIEEYNKNIKNQDPTCKDEMAKTLLDILLQVRETNPDFTESYLRSEVFSMLYTASESLSSGINFLYLMLAMHQDFQERAYNEIKSVLTDPNDSLSVEDLKKLKFLDQCIKETLRKFTTAQIMFRKATDDITLKDGKIIPKGCMIILYLHGVHHDPELYSDPQAWNPDNFAPDKDNDRNITPFGVGPRMCIGYQYAMMLIKTQAAHIIRTYHLTTNVKMQDLKIRLGIVSENIYGYRVQLTQRKN